MINNRGMDDGDFTTAERDWYDEVNTRLQRIGRWYASVRESLTEVESAGALTANRDVILTRKGNTLYVHLFKEPVTDAVKLHPMTDLPRRVVTLN